MSKFMRVREPGKHAIYNPVSGLHEVPNPATRYPGDHPLVKAAPWAFGTEEELALEVEVAARVTSVPQPQVEQATANPGEKRTVRRA